jgi:hypothetical protein
MRTAVALEIVLAMQAIGETQAIFAVPLAPQLLLSRLTRALLLELVGNLVDAGLRAGFVTRTARNVAARGG